MAAAQTVGDPACKLAAVGDPDPSLVPSGVAIGVGRAGDYTCLVW
jgi:hypothetical protein